jgi:hypothetical protein
MASLLVGVTVLIACAAPAALPPHQSLTWASGRYLDGMTVTFFLVGAVVLLRAAARPILAFAACVAALTVVAAVTVAVYAGTSLPTERGRTFNFGEPAVLTQNWSRASVLVATAAALGLLLVWVYFAILARYMRVLACVLGAAAAAVSLAAVAQLTAHCSRADSAWAQAIGIREMAAADGLKPGEQIAIASNLTGVLRIAQAFEVSSTQVQFFNPYRRPPPAGMTVVDEAWPTGQPARASWPDAPAGWRIVAANRFGSWVVWRRLWGPWLPGPRLTSAGPVRSPVEGRLLGGVEGGDGAEGLVGFPGHAGIGVPVPGARLPRPPIRPVGAGRRRQPGKVLELERELDR